MADLIIRWFVHYTQTPWGFLLVGAAFSSCLGDPIILRALPALHNPANPEKNFNSSNHISRKYGIESEKEIIKQILLVANVFQMNDVQM